MEALQDAQQCLRRFPFAFIHCRSVAVPYVRAQRSSHRVLLPFWLTNNNGMVNLLGFMHFELHIQRPVSFRCPGKNHHSAGSLIQSVDGP